jgi:anti-sigma factor RsiW
VSTPDRENLERPRQLMMAALDGEISGEDRGVLDGLLAGDAALRREFEQLERVKEVTSTMALTEPPEEIWDDYWTSVYNKFERGIGWFLVSIAAVVLVAFGLWHATGALLAETDMPGFVKIAVFALFLGGLLLLASVAREKLFTGRRDPYKGVKR